MISRLYDHNTKLRLLLCSVLSILLILADSKLTAFSSVRTVLNNLALGVQYVVHSPYYITTKTYNALRLNSSLKLENERLKQELLLHKSDLQLLLHYKNQNQRLNVLLGSSEIRGDDKLITQILSVSTNPFQKYILINKGSTDNVYIGQPVINEDGLVGQVISVSSHSSKVLLLIDGTHGMSVQNVRNDLRMILRGNGSSEYLDLEYVPSSADFVEGDVLLSSGLGAIYPEGYPVGIVMSIDNDEKRHFARIKVKPFTNFDRIRYLLLIWPQEAIIEEKK